MAISPLNTKTYNVDSFVDGNGVQYIGPAHTGATKDTVLLRRTPARGAATSTTVPKARSMVKFTKSVVINGVTTEIVISAEAAIPVGALKADVDSVRDDLGDFLIGSFGEALVWNGKINQ